MVVEVPVLVTSGFFPSPSPSSSSISGSVGGANRSVKGQCHIAVSGLSQYPSQHGDSFELIVLAPCLRTAVTCRTRVSGTFCSRPFSVVGDKVGNGGIRRRFICSGVEQYCGYCGYR